MCKYCGVKPKFGGYDYCGRSCGALAKAGGNSGGGGAPANSTMCEVCHQKPKFKETNSQGRVIVYPYCGRACASKASSTQGSSSSAPPKVVNQTPYTQLIPLAKNDPKYNDVANQFNVSWRNTSKSKPNVVHIYQVLFPQPVVDRYNSYRDAVERRGNFQSQGMSAGNQCRRWHGTTRACTLGDDPKNAKLCGQSGCALCNILKTSFNLSFVSGVNKFGSGIYASSTSAKADDYSNNKVKSPNKVIMLNKVVVGKGYKLLKTSMALTAPPAGYDSVLGETGQSLKHDEVIVYKNDAIRPAYVVVYR